MTLRCPWRDDIIMNFLEFHQQYGEFYLNKSLGLEHSLDVSTMNTDCQHWEFVTDRG